MHDAPATPPPVNDPHGDAPRPDLTVRKPWESAILSLLLLCGASWMLESVLTALSASPNAAWTWIHIVGSPQPDEWSLAQWAYGYESVSDLGALLMAAMAAARPRRTVAALRIAGALLGSSGLFYLGYAMSLTSQLPPPLSVAWVIFTLLGIAYVAPAVVFFVPRVYYETTARPAVAVATGLALYVAVASLGTPLFYLWWSAANKTFWFPAWDVAWSCGQSVISFVGAAAIYRVRWVTWNFGWVALFLCGGTAMFVTVQRVALGLYADGFECAARAVPAAISGVLWLSLMKCVRAEARVRGIGAACRYCEYDLTGNMSGVCPECGSAVR